MGKRERRIWVFLRPAETKLGFSPIPAIETCVYTRCILAYKMRILDLFRVYFVVYQNYTTWFNSHNLYFCFWPCICHTETLYQRILLYTTRIQPLSRLYKLVFCLRLRLQGLVISLAICRRSDSIKRGMLGFNPSGMQRGSLDRLKWVVHERKTRK